MISAKYDQCPCRKVHRRSPTIAGQVDRVGAAPKTWASRDAGHLFAASTSHEFEAMP